MKVTRFRAMYGTLILLLVAAIAGQWWSNSTHSDVTAPTLHYWSPMPAPRQFTLSIPAVPHQAPSPGEANQIPPDAKPFPFNGGRFYIVPIS